jgi:DNA polymerase-3 subunit delta
MKPDEFSKSLEKGEIAPLYYFHGDEPYLIDRAVRRLLDIAVSPESRDFNLEIFYGRDCRGDEIATAAQTLPMFAERRVVIVKRSNELSGPALEKLTDYASDPSPSSCLIFEGEKIDQRKKFFLEIKKTGKLVEFRRPYENRLAPFIREEAASFGKKVEPQALEALIYLVGNNLRELAAEVEKAAIFVGSRDTIRMDDIREVVSDTRVDSIFELTDAVGRKDIAKGLRSLNTILRDGEAPLMVLSMLARHFRQLWKVKELCARGVPQPEIAKAAGVNPYFLKGITEQSQNYRIPELKKAFELLFAADLALKTSGGKPASLLECLLMDICGEALRKRNINQADP